MRALSLLGWGLCATQGFADDRFQDTRYLGGHPDLPRKTSGVLVIAAREVRFEEKGGRLLLKIPITNVVAVEATTQWNEFPASPNKKEHIRIETRTGEDPTVTVVFETASQQSASIAAKIRFCMEQGGK